MEDTMETRIDRFKKAVEADDQEYLNGFNTGRDAALNGDELTAESTQAEEDGFVSAKQTMETMSSAPDRNRVFIQPHPLGGLQVMVFGSDGTKTSARITVEAGALLSVVLNMWLTTMLQRSFFEAAGQAATATESGIVIPGS